MTILLAAAACIATIHDGDTVRLCDGERVRIIGIDAPELPGSPRCNFRQRRTGRNASWCDYDLGRQSRDALAAFLRSGEVRIERQGQDRNGRTLATLSVNGHDAGRYLIAHGLARRWR